MGPASGLAADGRFADLAIEVPAEGVRYVLTTMYAGRDGSAITLSIPYVSGWGGPLTLGLSALGALLMWLGLLAFAVLRMGLPLPASIGQRLPVALATYRDRAEGLPPPPALRRATLTVLGIAAAGALLLGLAHLYLATSAWPAIVVTAVFAIGAAGLAIERHLERRRAACPPPTPSGA